MSASISRPPEKRQARKAPVREGNGGASLKLARDGDRLLDSTPFPILINKSAKLMRNRPSKGGQEGVGLHFLVNCKQQVDGKKGPESILGADGGGAA